MDDLIKLATGGISSTSAMGEGVTEGKSLTPSHCRNMTDVFSAIFDGKEGQAVEYTNFEMKKYIYEIRQIIQSRLHSTLA